MEIMGESLGGVETKTDEGIKSRLEPGDGDRESACGLLSSRCLMEGERHEANAGEVATATHDIPFNSQCDGKLVLSGIPSVARNIGTSCGLRPQHRPWQTLSRCAEPRFPDGRLTRLASDCHPSSSDAKAGFLACLACRVSTSSL